MAKPDAKGILLVLGLFFLLVLLNFIFFVDPRSELENEETGNRSSYLATPFGTLAFYTLLEESGFKVRRYEKPFTGLKQDSSIGALVVIAPPIENNPGEEEWISLLEWIEAGGLLIIVDREIQVDFGGATARSEPAFGLISRGVIRPLQPTQYTRGVERITLSQYASRVSVDSHEVTYHLGDDYGAVLADTKIGKGRVVMLTDQHIIANNGISKADNAVLALNLFSERPPGDIAFDEYHHGRAAVATPREGLLSYFRGTPVPWMIAQVAIIAAIIIYSFGRRFTRPIPLRRERRTTNLEFVSSMANITRLAQASDLAMQNIYSEFRKRLCRYNGLPPKADNARLAAATSRRSAIDEQKLKSLLDRCQEIASGRKVMDGELLRLVTHVREIESKLNL
ncbi:MAG TPA: DUF4350 domain-containing protein [Blastocatellia bacterium]|jgi:hypothetical protein